MAGAPGLNPPGLCTMGAGWPVWYGVGVGRDGRGAGRLADGEAAARRAGLEVAGAGCW